MILKVVQNPTSINALTPQKSFCLPKKVAKLTMNPLFKSQSNNLKNHFFSQDSKK